MMDFTTLAEKSILDETQSYADKNSTCAKVRVGSTIIVKGSKPIRGANHGVNNCKKNGCRRIKLYGNASKEHRLPSDCDSIHSEVDAICKAAKSGVKLEGAAIYVTRYPCEACARAIAASGIKKVVYGRNEIISPYTALILSAENVEVIHRADWQREDNNE